MRCGFRSVILIRFGCILSIWTDLRRKHTTTWEVLVTWQNAGACVSVQNACWRLLIPSNERLPQCSVSAARPWDSRYRNRDKESWRRLEWHVVAINKRVASRSRAAKRSLCWWYTAADHWIAPVWPHLVCISSPLLDKRTNKRAFAFLRSSAVRPGHHNRTHPEKTPTVCKGGCGGLRSHRRREERKKKPHTGTQSSHLKFTDRAVSGGEQERLKMWHRALCVRLGKQRGDVPDKQRSPTLRSYLIRHQSFPLLPTRIQVNYLHLGRICSSARKWLFSAPSEDCPFWITWYYFVASFSGHTGYPLLCRPPDRFLRVRFAPHEPADTSAFNSTPCLFIYASAKPARERALPRPLFVWLWLWIILSASPTHGPRRPRVPGARAEA